MLIHGFDYLMEFPAFCFFHSFHIQNSSARLCFAIAVLLSLFIHQTGREIKASIYPHRNTHKTRKASFTMSRDYPFLQVGPMESSRSGSSYRNVEGAAASAREGMSRSSLFLPAGRPMGLSYRNDDDCYVDDKLVQKLQRKCNSVMQLMNKAEERQFTEPNIKEWLVSIKHTMYDANALLDKIDTEARFREKYKEDGSPSYSIRGLVQWATSEMNRIIEELKDMVEEAGDMGLKSP